MPVDDLRGKRVVVVGLGSSGVAACRLLASRGAKVTGTDVKPRAAASAEALALEPLGVPLALGGHDEAPLAEADLVVLSPGVPTFPALERAERAGVPVWGEVELSVRCLAREAPVVAVGGTNGKSTTTSLVGAILERAGKRVFVGGNLGEPLAARADEAYDVVVLEVSSFQMERVDRFRPRAAVLLNVTPDHLDRYESFDAYARAKGNAFARQTERDLAVVPYGDPVCMREARRGAARVATFGPGGDVEVRADAVVDHETEATFARASFGLRGGHNALNIAAAIAAVRPFEVPSETIAGVLATFRGLPHRTAFVREADGVRYYDDSKGTNVDASVVALRGMSEDKVVLVCGGRDKGGSYAPLVAALRERGRAVVLLGEAADAIARAVGDVVPVRRAGSMDEAVRLASEIARAGDAVLLSPACSSFDMFKDYKARGDAFIRAALALPGEASR